MNLSALLHPVANMVDLAGEAVAALAIVTAGAATTLPVAPSTRPPSRGSDHHPDHHRDLHLVTAPRRSSPVSTPRPATRRGPATTPRPAITPGRRSSWGSPTR